MAKHDSVEERNFHQIWSLSTRTVHCADLREIPSNETDVLGLIE